MRSDCELHGMMAILAMQSRGKLRSQAAKERPKVAVEPPAPTANVPEAPDPAYMKRRHKLLATKQRNR